MQTNAGGLNLSDEYWSSIDLLAINKLIHLNESSKK